MKKKRIWIILIIVIIVAVGAGYYFFNNNSNNEQTSQVAKTDSKKAKPKKKVIPKKKQINIVAIGDSLTQGVGDSRKNGGGYVTRLRTKVQSKYNVKTQAANYGVSGDTSNQIMARIKSDKKMHQDLPKADIITVTVGGNDFMHLLQRKGLDLTAGEIADEQVQFDKRLKKLLTDIRNYNENAPIYLVGIYNPFSIYLSNVKNAKIAFINWNKGSEKVAAGFKKTYFVDINNLYQTKQINKKVQKSGVNPYLYKKDHFHPNGVGYDMMTQKIFVKVNDTTKEWLFK
ncbi:GDSL-type esterase/lipase family protein [Companilactobacillus alimentarius]|uniref:Lipase n=1 Tax=Companilactobacillus alimentarius DSM 20249 TaxID=1423720 RepID=A0A2K9HEZ3_9LACO|nr:GDSL-type esterase/lipase family protein [Companilactobacillus alimentarius]AUI71129.1 lipase [Companilactobacillus alimentarius DSM 20249]KRK75255.1 lysophospholipase l1-like esterase [Companilactobacillus alimentarius DSM 20249]MDT6951607.1 GDSL-type esterase/lipase family protein [Companilactobacillus alimentarius]GEO43966.1 lipase/acylhydrolase [Companilactobacillus alimentarius]